MMPHLLVVTIVLPLLSTVEVVASGMRAELFSVGTAPLVFTLFMPLCLTGDTLMAARRGVSWRAYSGPWLEERPRQRLLRLGLMQATMGRGAMVRGRGIGNLDRRACYRALKSWFSFLQVLINLLG
ncbi:uncharacterized protein LOC117654368 [Thrips palmi]|uniref:Uncharacterized protein LOC117654368 n=1 Tax=Thrips palmi TaxID=161013 RepID=A0A6P9AMQ9_THRPL|nr:uncharacterized protein LOC117654368 [Thrips palmi]